MNIAGVIDERRSGYVCAILASMMFGAVPIIAKPLVSTVNPFTLSMLSYLGAFFIFGPIAYKSKIVFKKNDYLILLVIGIGSAFFSPLLYFIGLNQSTASDTSLLSNAEIVFTVFLAILFFKEKLKPIGYVAMGLVLMGVVIITTNFEFSESLFAMNIGHFMILGSTALWALDNNLSRIITSRINSARIVQVKYGIGGIMMLLTMIVFQIPFEINFELLPHIILLSIVGFAGALYFFLLSLKRIGTLKTIAIFSLSSVFGLIFSFLILGEKISQYQIMAIAIMLSGIYLINKKSSSV